jgi:cystathionine gamma-lyase
VSDDIDARIARLTHLRAPALRKGDPVALPITPAATFHLPGDPAGVVGYGRFGNPTWDAVEAALAELEGAPVVTFPSGMAAISATLLTMLRTGDRILLPSDGYYTTRSLVDRFLAPLGIDADLRPTADFEAGDFDGYRMVFIETPSNPGLDVCDIEAVAAAAHEAGALVVVDNTTLTPLGQRPLDHGADIVVASDTKAPSGHADVLFGHVASRDAERLTTVADWRRLAGPIPSPFEAWAVHRGLETLEIRFERACASAGVIAERLIGHPAVGAVRYPGLPGDPSFEIARRQQRRFGFLIGLTLASAEAAETFIERCPLLAATTSFGSAHSSAERRARWGDAVAPGFIRLSVGVEPVEELWAAIDAALRE